MMLPTPPRKCVHGEHDFAYSQVVLVVKNLPPNARDVRNLGSSPVSGRSPGGGNGNPL